MRFGRGDGFRFAPDGKPRDANPDGNGNLVRAFHMPSTCQLHALPGQDWNRSHRSWNDGRNDGFVEASTAVAMGYWDETDIPFYYGLAQHVPAVRPLVRIGARADLPEPAVPDGRDRGRHREHDRPRRSTAPPPPNGTIFDRFHAHGISWRNYYTDLPSAAIILKTLADYPSNLSKIDQFYTDAAAGTLPSFSLVDPNFDTESEENPQDLRHGEQLAAKVINAVMHSPELGEDAAHLDLRRARWLLRPRAAAARGRARRHPAGHRRATGPPGRVRPLLVPRAGGDRVAVRAAATTCRTWCTTTRRC